LEPSILTVLWDAFSAWEHDVAHREAESTLDPQKVRGVAKKALARRRIYVGDFRDQLRQIKKLRFMESISKTAAVRWGPFAGIAAAAQNGG